MESHFTSKTALGVAIGVTLAHFTLTTVGWLGWSLLDGFMDDDETSILVMLSLFTGCTWLIVLGTVLSPPKRPTVDFPDTPDELNC